MFYRTVAIFIVLFWLTMTGLLVHQQIRPADSVLREIPVSHVVKLFFMRRQEPHPALGIFSGGRIGSLKLTPQIDEKTQNHNLKFDGWLDVSASLVSGKRERIAWNGEWEMDKYLSTQRFRLAVVTHSPINATSEVIIVPAENTAYYELRSSSGVLEHEHYSLDEQGIRTALGQLGVDPAIVQLASKQVAASSPTIKSRLSTLSIRGESIDTYLTTIEVNGQTLLECHVDQLGKVVRLTSGFLNATLAPDDMMP